MVKRGVRGRDRPGIRNVVPVIAQRRREERHQPDRIDAQVLQVVELLREPAEISISVARAVVKSADVDLINDRVLVPKPVLGWQFSFPESLMVEFPRSKSLVDAKAASTLTSHT